MKRGCDFCGKEMNLIMENEEYRLWACPPGGCSRLFLEDAKGQLAGTWYLAEKNDGPRGL